MNEILYTKIINSTAHRASREENAAYIFNNPSLFNDLFTAAITITDKNHHKACWIMELVLERQLDLIFPKNDIFCATLPQFRNESALRSISKIALFLVDYNNRKTKLLSDKNIEVITETCFDWLINDTKVASKAYAIQALYLLGKENPWIYPELKQLLQQGFPDHSPAYQSVARKILKKI
ncbi:hypothetical protein [Flavobacterium sp. CAU 1735]|uniref:hypothetical protein n=1 Tax=Flavobacterium sp. CAU 1735 TaxID=3140361 RepID=UPI0032617C3C